MTRAAAQLFATRAALFLAVALGVGCSLRPQPEPPPAEPGPELDGDLLTARPTPPAAMFGGGISGAPGASPAGALLRAYNLDSSFPPAEVVVGSDGSFELSMDMLEGDEVRLQAFVGGKRSKPLDVIIGPDNSIPIPASRALAACLSVAPTLELDLGQVGSAPVDRAVVIANGCSFEVTVGAVGMRSPVDGLSVTSTGPMPVVVPSGGSSTVAIQYDAPSGTVGEVEDILLIEVVAPERDRRPVTVFAEVESI
jgi:hypothetical protein